ncbi:MAG: class I SAM-dependent methyltransferase [Nitrospirae bacterium]|nr:class I SAM-dependent methyltransferase [Nitrospirota bacterium]
MLQILLPQPGETILVVAAGGGYDAVGIQQSLHPAQARIICVEPSEIFSAHIPRTFEIYNSSFDCIPLASHSVDAVVNLAAMHHIDNRSVVLREWTRLLKPGGRLVIGDVEEDSTNAEFMNTVVNEFTPGGHRGIFLVPGQLSNMLRDTAEWDEVEECRCDFFWEFTNEQEMLEFTQLIFGMVKANREQIRSALQQYLGATSDRSGGYRYPWSLRFCRGIKSPVLEASLSNAVMS